MTKQEFMSKLHDLYRVANASDSDDSPQREAWTTPDFASTVCQPLDNILHNMVKAGVLTRVEHQAFIDTL